jgi:hypothetical protein
VDHQRDNNLLMQAAIATLLFRVARILEGKASQDELTRNL